MKKNWQNTSQIIDLSAMKGNHLLCGSLMSLNEGDQHQIENLQLLMVKKERSMSSTHQENTNMMIIQSRYIQGGVWIMISTKMDISNLKVTRTIQAEVLMISTGSCVVCCFISQPLMWRYRHIQKWSIGISLFHVCIYRSCGKEN